MPPPERLTSGSSGVAWLLLALALIGSGTGSGAAAGEAAVAAAPADTTGVAALIAAHQAALGGEAAIGAGAGWELSGEARAAGGTGKFHLIALRSAPYRLDLDLGSLSERSGFDGRDAWVHDMNGVTRRLRLREREEAILRAALLIPGYLAGASGAGDLGFDLRRLESTPAADVVELTLAEREADVGPGLELHLDRSTHLITAAVWHDVFGTVRTEIGDYRPVSGVLIPHRIDRRMPGGLDEQYQVTTARSVAPGAVPPPSAFAAPPTRSNVTFSSAAGAVVPLRMVGQHILVAARVNGRDAGLFFLDTGAGGNCVNLRIARELELPVAGDVAAAGVGGIETSEFRRVQSLELDGVRLGEHVLVALDLEPIEELMGVPIGGIVGYDFLSQIQFSLDYDERTCVMRPRATESPPRGREVSLLLLRNVPLLPGMVDDRFPGWFRLDTGASMSLVLHRWFVEAHDLHAEPMTGAAEARGVGGTQRIQMRTLEAFTFGGERFTRFEAGFALAEEGALADLESAGTIGGELLRQMTMTFDYAGESAWLERRPQGADRGFGFGARFDGDRLLVTEVKADRPAARSGLEAGDHIVRVRGRAIDRSLMLDLADIFRFAADEEAVEMAIERSGEERILTLHYPSN